MFAKWGCAIEPTAGGCDVTEYARDLRPDEWLEASAEISGITDRESRNRETMSATLDRLAAALE